MTFPPTRSLPHPETSVYQHWQRLNDWLYQHRLLWRPVPFREPMPPWAKQSPELASWLGQLGDRQCKHYEEAPSQLAEDLHGWFPRLADYPSLVAVADLSPGAGAIEAATLTERDAVDMPGRKRLQAGAFTAAAAPIRQPLLDWCCGKGHLARTLARQGDVPVTGYEWNARLVEDGNRLVRRYSDPVILECRDVMARDLPWPHQAHAVALHACGDLHRKLIGDSARLRQPRVTFSPCCYHLTEASRYVPLSARARAAGESLLLERDELRLAVQETVTAPARVREQTVLVSQWRLGFDGLQRWLRGVDDYLPLPPHPKSLQADGFPAFCLWAAERKGLELPGTVDFEHWRNHGVTRAALVRRYELLRHLFRRPLELWLVLDYALFLEDAGYQVRVGTFCDRALTPRNLMVDAKIAHKKRRPEAPFLPSTVG